MDRSKRNLDAYLVERLHDVSEVEPGPSVGGHLMEEIVAEQLQQVTVARLRPASVQRLSKAQIARTDRPIRVIQASIAFIQRTD